MFIVAPVVQKFTTVPKPAKPRFFVIFTNIRLIVPSDGGAQIGRGPNGALSYKPGTGITRSGVLWFVVLRIIVNPSVYFIVFFAFQFFVDL